MDLEKQFKQNLEHTLDTHFPKGKSGERSGGLMLYASAILEHERVMCLVRKHLGTLLALNVKRGSPEYESACDFYDSITKS